MPEPESPQIRWDRVSAVVVAVSVCLALPTVAVLVYDVFAEDNERRKTLISLVIGAITGGLIPFLYWAPYRSLGLVDYAATAWFAVSIYSVATGHWPGWAHGIPLGIIISAITRARRGTEPPEETYWLVAAGLIGAAAGWVFISQGRPFIAAGYYVLAISSSLLVWVWIRLFRPAFEMTLEPVVWLLYKVYGRGSGLKDFPRTGPCIVIANHACWLDPLFLAKVLPRPVTPMMTGRFYNLPILRRLMIAFGVIQVSEKVIKKDAPEIREAIAALDRGECLVIFPEGYLRRTEEQLLRRFGQGIWQILQARPNTPIYACWIEGGWGSYTSYLNGLPTKNKKVDIRRPLGIGVSPAATVPQEILTDHMQTRFYLM
ncbi:MAG TPA: lysophospholipid acyltransferase family protein, partial [Gemmata sp.]|nr:lysophospholipid acyltransferase family protein [Gemmata sp.]